MTCHPVFRQEFATYRSVSEFYFYGRGTAFQPPTPLRDPSRDVPVVPEEGVGFGSQNILLKQDNLHRASTLPYPSNESGVPTTNLDVTAGIKVLLLPEAEICLCSR